MLYITIQHVYIYIHLFFFFLILAGSVVFLVYLILTSGKVNQYCGRDGTAGRRLDGHERD